MHLASNDFQFSRLAVVLRATAEKDFVLAGIQWALQSTVYRIDAVSIGHAPVDFKFEATTAIQNVPVSLGKASGFQAEVNDATDNPIPVKATIYSLHAEHE